MEQGEAGSVLNMLSTAVKKQETLAPGEKVLSKSQERIDKAPELMVDGRQSIFNSLASPEKREDRARNQSLTMPPSRIMVELAAHLPKPNVALGDQPKEKR